MSTNNSFCSIFKIRSLRNTLIISLVIVICFPLVEQQFIYPKFYENMVSNQKSISISTDNNLINSARNGKKSNIEVTKQFKDLAYICEQNMSINRIVLTDKDAMTLFSTDGTNIGQKEPVPKSVKNDGEKKQEVLVTQIRNHDGEETSQHIVRSIIPIHQGNQYLGSLEISCDISKSQHNMDELLLLNGWSILAMGGGLSMIILLSLLRASGEHYDKEQATLEAEMQKARFQHVSSSALDAIVILDATGNITYWNKSAERMFDYPKEKVIDQKIWQLIFPENKQETYASAFMTFQETGAGPLLELGKEHNALKSNGKPFPVHITMSQLTQNGTQNVITMIKDISHDKEAEQRLKLGARVIESMNQSILITDNNLRMKIVNPAFTRMTGYRLNDAVGKSLSLLSSGWHSPEFFQEVGTKLSHNGSWNGEIWVRHIDGPIARQWLELTAVRNDTNTVTHYVGVFTPITEKKTAAHHQNAPAGYDDLTGLANSEMFYENLKQMIKESKRDKSLIGVMFVSFDSFKDINEKYGHKTGDLILQQTAARLKEILREVDIISRFRGGIFSLILPGIHGKEDITIVTKKIAKLLNQPFKVDGREHTPAHYIGYTIFPEDGDLAEILVENAEGKMHDNKQQALLQDPSEAKLNVEIDIIPDEDIVTETEVKELT